MTSLNTPKKPAPSDWHPADVVCALHKAEWTLRKLAAYHGISKSPLTIALRRPYPKSEARIAAAIGVAPATIWPTRYNPDGSPKSGRNQRGIGRHWGAAKALKAAKLALKAAQVKHTKAPGKRNVRRPAATEHSLSTKGTS